MMAPLVTDLAELEIPGVVTCFGVEVQQARGLPVVGESADGTDWTDARLINVELEVHLDDPAFGYRFIAD
jgi:putative transposase